MWLLPLQVCTSMWWLRRFRFGPMEWLWRSLAYGKLQHFRRDAAEMAMATSSTQRHFHSATDGSRHAINHRATKHRPTAAATGGTSIKPIQLGITYVWLILFPARRASDLVKYSIPLLRPA
jgi:Protein of unknown function (DUF418)